MVREGRISSVRGRDDDKELPSTPRWMESRKYHDKGDGPYPKEVIRYKEEDVKEVQKLTTLEKINPEL